MASKIRSSSSDKFGIFSAVLCIIHCTLLPFAVALVTSMDSPFGGYDYFIDTLFIVISLTAVYFSSRHSSSISIKSALWFFVLVFISGVILEHVSSYGQAIALLGSLGLIIAHFFNLRHCRKAHLFNS